MAFVAPIFALAGLVLMGLPILIHLLNRRRYRVVEWAAMRYLLEAVKQNRRRRRFESWFLLAVRALIVLLLGLALARPLGCDGRSAQMFGATSSGLTVVIMDDSLSTSARLGDAPGFDALCRRAREWVMRQREAGGRVALVATAPARVVIAPTFDVDAVLQSLDQLEPARLADDLAGAIEMASDLDLTARPTLHLFSDLARGSFDDASVARLSDVATALADVELFVHLLTEEARPNAAVTRVAPAEPLVRVGFRSELTAQIAAHATTSSRTLAWSLDGRPMAQGMSVYSSASTPMLLGELAAEGLARSAVAEVRLEGSDALADDDVRFAAIETASRLPVLVVEGWRDGNAALRGAAGFVRLGLAPAPDSSDSPSYVALELSDPAGLATRTLDDLRAVVLASVSTPGTTWTPRLAEFVRQGGVLMVFTGPRIDAAAYNATFAPAGLMPGQLLDRVELEPSAEIGFDFDPAQPHPALAAFRNYDRSGLAAARVFSFWRLAPNPDLAPVTVLALAGNAGPAVIEHRLGAGRVIFATIGADAQSTTLVARPAFVAMLHELLSFALGTSGDWRNLTTGERLVLPGSLSASAPTLSDPDGASINLIFDAATRRWSSPPLSRAGVYRVLSGDSNEPVVVNVPVRESDLTPVEWTTFVEALPGLRVNRASEQVESLASDRADFAWPLMLALLPLLGAESWYAMRLGRRGAPR
jgi:hypothetical protein